MLNKGLFFFVCYRNLNKILVINFLVLYKLTHTSAVSAHAKHYCKICLADLTDFPGNLSLLIFN